MYCDKEWTEQGATLSDKAAKQEYGLTQEELIAAMKAGILDYRCQSMHGNPWYRLLRREVEALVEKKEGKAGLQAQKNKTELASIERQLRSLHREIKKLERRREELKAIGKK